MFIPYANNTDTDKLADSSRKANLIASFWKKCARMNPRGGGGSHFSFIFEKFLQPKKCTHSVHLPQEKTLKFIETNPKTSQILR